MWVFYTLYFPFSGNSGLPTWVRLQLPQDQRYPVLQVHAGSFRHSVIHRTMTWSTGPLTCVCDHSASQHSSYKQIYCAPNKVRTSGLWISSPTLYQLILGYQEPNRGGQDWVVSYLPRKLWQMLHPRRLDTQFPETYPQTRKTNTASWIDTVSLQCKTTSGSSWGRIL